MVIWTNDMAVVVVIAALLCALLVTAGGGTVNMAIDVDEGDVILSQASVAVYRQYYGSPVDIYLWTSMGKTELIHVYYIPGWGYRHCIVHGNYVVGWR